MNSLFPQSYHNTRQKAREATRAMKARIGTTHYITNPDGNDTLVKVVRTLPVADLGKAHNEGDRLWLSQYEVEVL